MGLSINLKYRMFVYEIMKIRYNLKRFLWILLSIQGVQGAIREGPGPIRKVKASKRQFSQNRVFPHVTQPIDAKHMLILNPATISILFTLSLGGPYTCVYICIYVSKSVYIYQYIPMHIPRYAYPAGRPNGQPGNGGEHK